MPKFSRQETLDRQKKYAKGLHWCSRCKEYKPAAEFNNHKTRKLGKHQYCKVCHKSARDPATTKQYFKERAYEFKSYYVKEAGGKCHRCGYNEYIGALDFHHINKEDKEHHPQNIINNGNHEKTVTELNKCVLLCSNCHRAYNGGFWVAEFIKREGLGWTIKPGTIQKKYRLIQLGTGA